MCKSSRSEFQKPMIGIRCIAEKGVSRTCLSSRRKGGVHLEIAGGTARSSRSEILVTRAGSQKVIHPKCIVAARN
ncbi:hypothetical protein BS78_K063000 [Paspalum vaginatum]|uniref:Uncharacterized protein n=1 Tax=Paspalum vaginatum TaxID=158149 RepID=A0A9W7X8E4_9POAL|nr:hypothetical protein BS78_K063000 [Paspalum vaginatum]